MSLRQVLFFLCVYMNEPYSILMQKMKGGSPIKDLVGDFDIVCVEIPFEPFGETKDLTTRDWADEDGEDVYVPQMLRIKAYDWKIKAACKGETSTKVIDKITALTGYLSGASDGNGAEMKIYSSHLDIGRKNVYMKSVGDFEHFKDAAGNEVVEFSITFRVADPRTQIIPSYSITIPKKIVALVEKV
ncbi:hypothetical protein IX296_002019 [Bacteroides pyogenes]|nr:hypothetical protein [Bacteroides pyogenes]MBR8754850.1 hypothetical protein [Bacteroides pyogenes]MBR8809725.1 hypothetical protein [Bacteroides pyogenes]